MNRLEALLYNFETDHDTASKIIALKDIHHFQRLDTINAMWCTNDIVEWEAEPKFYQFYPLK